MKKLISMILTFAIMCLPVVSYTAETDTSDKTAGREVVFLEKLGILTDAPTDNPVTRAGFVELMLKTLDVEVSEDSGTQHFSDVDRKYYAFDTISAAYDRGLVGGNGYGKFNPDEQITLNEAVTIAMRALNYGYLENYSVYQSIVRDNDLTDNVVPNEDGTLNEIQSTTLIYNTLMADYNEITEISGDGSVNYDTSSETTLLETIYDISEIKGIVNAERYTALDGYAKTNSDWILIGDTEVKDTERLSADCLGYYTEAFVKEVDTEYELFWMEKTRNSEVVITADDISDETTVNKIVEVNENDRKKSYSPSGDFTLIYNGKNYKGFGRDIFNIKSGSIKLVDNNCDNIYEVVFVEEYVNYVVKSTSDYDKCIYLKNTDTILELDGNADVFLTDGDGNAATLADISENTILTVMMSADGSFAKIITGTGYKVLTPSEIDEEGLIANGTEYKFDDAVKNNHSDIKLGRKGIFYFDAYGDISYFEYRNEDIAMYAYLLEVYDADAELKDSEIKIINEYNEILVLKLKKTVKLNDTKINSGDAIDALCTDGNVKRQLVRYKSDDDGVLTDIWTATDKSSETDYIGYTENVFTLDYKTGSSSSYRAGNMKMLDTKYIMDSNTLRLVVPEDADDDEDYIWLTCAGLAAKDNGNFWVYDSDKQRNAAVVIENTKSSSNFTGYKPIFVVNKVVRALNKKGDECYRIEGYYQGKYQSMDCEDDLADSGEWIDAFGGKTVSQLKCGDVIQVSVSQSTGMITGMRILYLRDMPDAFDQKSNDTLTDYRIYAYLYTTSAKVLEQHGKSLIARTNKLATEETAAQIRTFPLLDSTYYYMYDSAKDKLIEVNKNENMENKNVFVCVSLENVVCVIVYK